MYVGYVGDIVYRVVYGYTTLRVQGPKYWGPNTINITYSIWALRPYYLGPWTLRARLYTGRRGLGLRLRDKLLAGLAAGVEVWQLFRAGI